MNTRWLSIIGVPAFALLFGLTPASLTAFAQEAETEEASEAEEGAGEESEEGEEEEGGPLALAMRWLNFAILFGGLGYLLREPAVAFFEARREEILGGLQKSRAAQKDAAARMSDVEGRLSRLSTEMAGIKSDAEESARTERERIVADAEVEAGRAVEQSGAEIERLARGMEQEIRSHIAEGVVRSAEEKLRSKLTGDDHGRIVRRAVDKL